MNLVNAETHFNLFRQLWGQRNEYEIGRLKRREGRKIGLAARLALPDAQSHPATIPRCPALIGHLVKHVLVSTDLVPNEPGSVALISP